MCKNMYGSEWEKHPRTVAILKDMNADPLPALPVMKTDATTDGKTDTDRLLALTTSSALTAPVTRGLVPTNSTSPLAAAGSRVLLPSCSSALAPSTSSYRADKLKVQIYLQGKKTPKRASIQCTEGLNMTSFREFLRTKLGLDASASFQFKFRIDDEWVDFDSMEDVLDEFGDLRDKKVMKVRVEPDNSE